MITKFGKRFLTTCIAGMNSFNRQDLAIGIDSTSPNVNGNDTRLGFEFYRLPVSFGGIDIQTVGGVTTYSVVYKTTIPQDVAGTITEIGLYPSSRTSVNNYDNKFIADFEDNLIWFDSLNANPSLVTTPTPRIGNSMIQVTATANTTKEFKTSFPFFDISGYSSNDTLTLAINQGDSNLDYINVRFYTSETSYYQISYDGSDIDTGTGNKILSRSLSTMTSVNTPGPLVSKVSVIVAAKSSGTTNVYFDGLRINDEDTFDPTFGIIARSTVSPITKVTGRPLDLEYKLGINF
ncbi:MAG: hypothetical protein ACO3UU_06785 [Minisyncoccia bacterium]